jgi:hypothetical protein
VNRGINHQLLLVYLDCTLTLTATNTLTASYATSLPTMKQPGVLQNRMDAAGQVEMNGRIT